MEFQRCARCIMDNASDSTITFDHDGICNYCTDALKRKQSTYFPNQEGERKLSVLINAVKENGEGKKYDCIMGISGGLDSSYLAYLGYKWGLRILLIHVDDGYDTQISKSNLANLVKATGFDYETITPDAVQYNALTRAYMKAGVPNIAIPQDNVLFAYLYSCMRKYHIKYFLSGGNFALECILQKGNTYTAYDIVNLKDINRRFGTQSVDKLKLISELRRAADEYLFGIKTVRPLNYVDYNRDRAFKELSAFCGFQYYGRKHLENILTAFIQLYWFPKKFGVDKRTSHLSSMIVSGQMTRDEALKELSEPLYGEKQMAEYIKIIKEKMSLSDDEFEEIMSSPVHQHTDYCTQDSTIMYRVLRSAGKRILRLKQRLKS